MFFGVEPRPAGSVPKQCSTFVNTHINVESMNPNVLFPTEEDLLFSRGAPENGVRTVFLCNICSGETGTFRASVYQVIHFYMSLRNMYTCKSCFVFV